MNSPLFRKESVGLNPFVSNRDCLIFGGIVSLSTALFLALGWWTFAPQGMVRAMFFGALGGMIPSLVVVLPVRGVVRRSERARFVAVIERLRFVAANPEQGLSIYVFPGPWWAKWDSKRVVVQDSEGGELLATVPLYVYRKLRAEDI